MNSLSSLIMVISRSVKWNVAIRLHNAGANWDNKTTLEAEVEPLTTTCLYDRTRSLQCGTKRVSNEKYMASRRVTSDWIRQWGAQTIPRLILLKLADTESDLEL